MRAALAEVKSEGSATGRPAAQALRPGRVLQRCSCGGSGGECAECKAKRRLQRQSAGQIRVGAAPPVVDEVLRRPGQPLDPATRSWAESRLGHDFSQVRIHTDARAADSAQAVNALAYTVGRDVVFGAGQYRPGAAAGQRLLAHELVHVAQQQAGGGADLAQPAAFPAGAAIAPADSPAEQEAEVMAQRAVAGEPVQVSGQAGSRSGLLQREQAGAPTEAVDKALKARNDAVEKGLFEAADNYFQAKDLRWFFAYAHAMITHQINQNLSAFQRPNDLIRLNLSFALEFLKAVQGQPSAAWQNAFKVCQGLQKGSNATVALVGETELCGAAMANVHIHVDLANALRTVGCIPAADYGNMLVFVNRGSLAALVRLRGRGLGEAEAILQYVLAPKVGLDVKAWRNEAYQAICKTPVPDPQPNFLKPK